MNQNNSMTHDTKDWEQEFDVKFNAGMYWTFENGDVTQLKLFIHHQLQKAREEERVITLKDVNDYLIENTNLTLNDIDATILNCSKSANNTWSQCNDCFDGEHEKCLGIKYGCQCKCLPN